MAVDSVIESKLGVSDFASYEEKIYTKYQEIAEQEIIETLFALLSSCQFLELIKQWGLKCGCSYKEYRTVTIRLKSGKTWEISSPVFLRGKPKGKRGRKPKRQKGRVRHLGLELLGIMYRLSPALMEMCVSMAVLCPSFEVAANALRGLGVAMNEHLLQKITCRFAGLAKNTRVECNGEEVWQNPGNRILICVDGGRIRERCKKRGKRREDQKRQGYHTEWFEPRLLTISLFDENGIRVIQLQNIGDAEFVNDYRVFTSKEKADELISNNIYPGDIILSKMGDPVGRACLIPDIHERYVMCSDGIRLVVEKDTHSRYFIYSYINSPKFRSLVEKTATGSTRKRIGLNELKNLPLFVPQDRKEQQKIADCLSSLDELIELQVQKLDALKAHKKGLMQQLFPQEVA